MLMLKLIGYIAYCVAFGLGAVRFDNRFRARMLAERRLAIKLPRVTGLYFHAARGR